MTIQETMVDRARISAAPNEGFLPPPLKGVNFPDQEVDYPSDWPPEFRYPHQYIPVELSSGTFPESDSTALSSN